MTNISKSPALRAFHLEDEGDHLNDEKDRKEDHPIEYLKDFKGKLVTDGYQGYRNIKDVEVAGCWVHLKRKFATYTKALGSNKAKGTLALTAVNKISKIFYEDKKLKNLNDDQRLIKRKELIEPLVDEFFDWVKKYKDIVPAKSETGKGFTYAINEEPYLRVFLTDPNIPLDNNAAERSIRDFTIGRKNWVMIDTPKGAKASAAIYSIVETAKLNNLRLYDYLEYLLEELPKYCNNANPSIPEKLLPWSSSLPDRLKNNN